jgi:predicted nucleotidyltransferase
MRFEIINPIQEEILKNSAQYLKRRLCKDSEYIIFRGSRTCSPLNMYNYYSDIDVLIATKKDINENRLILRDNILYDISIKNIELVEKDALDLNSDNLDRTSFMCLSYFTKDKNKLKTLESKIKNTIVNDYKRFINNCFDEKVKVFAHLSDILLYPLMMDCYRIPNLHKSTEIFLESAYLQENISLQKQELKKQIIENDYISKIRKTNNAELIKDILKIETEKTEDNYLFPPILKKEKRKYPDNYYNDETSEIDNKIYNFRLLFKKENHFDYCQKNIFLFRPDIKQIIDNYNRKD